MDHRGASGLGSRMRPRAGERGKDPFSLSLTSTDPSRLSRGKTGAEAVNRARLNATINTCLLSYFVWSAANATFLRGRSGLGTLCEIGDDLAHGR